MACSHNQAKIDDLTKEIEALGQDKTDLETNINIYKKNLSFFLYISIFKSGNQKSV